MIGHQAIGRTDEILPCEGVAESFPQPRVVQRIELAGGPAGEIHRPMNPGKTAIKAGREPAQATLVKGALRVH